MRMWFGACMARALRSANPARLVLAWAIGLTLTLLGAAPALAADQFTTLQPPFTQSLYGVQSVANLFGGVTFAPNGDVLVDSCSSSGGTLYRFDHTTTLPTTHGSSTLHPATTLASNTGCGLAADANGFIYTNTGSGVLKLDPNTGNVIAGPFGPPGNALGIAVDPVTGNLVYVENDASLGYVDPGFTTHGSFSTATAGNGFIDQIAFDPTGQYLFVSYDGGNSMLVLRRDGTLVQRIPLTVGSGPDGIAFHAAAPQFVVTNDNDGTMTRFDFPNNDFTKTPVQSPFATGGFRGDHAQVGPDGCLYATQNGARYDDGTVDSRTNSLVQICPGFAPPPGVSQGCASASGGRQPSLHVSVDGNNNSDTASGSGWAPGAQVNIYLDTAAGAHYVGTTTSDSNGSFTSTGLASFANFLPTEPAELQAAPNETFPIVAMDGSCDAATVTTLTATTPNGTVLTSSHNTSNGGCTAKGVSLSTNAPNSGPPTLPLQTDGRWIVDSSNRTPPTRVKLTSVNWYGAEQADFVAGGLQCQSLDTIANRIASMGFNSVRLPWSNAMFEQNPSPCTPTDLAETQSGTNVTCIPPEVLAANTQLLGQPARSILKAVVDALAKNHVMVILDDHGTDANFTPTPFDGIWWGGQYWDDLYGFRQQIDARTQQWINDWMGMVNAFKDQPYVVGVDLRNESSPTKYCNRFGPITINCVSPSWGASNSPGTDNWRAAAQQAGNAVLSDNSNLLVMVEGVNYSLDLKGVHDHPVVLNVSNRVVYSPHSYPFDVEQYISYKELHQQLGRDWGFILTQNRPWTAPIWVGEFGATASQITTQSTVGDSCGNHAVSADDAWFSCFSKYLSDADIDWAWWAVDGTESDGGPFATNRTFYTPESYGIFDPSWSQNSSLPLIEELQNLQAISQRPTQ